VPHAADALEVERLPKTVYQHKENDNMVIYFVRSLKYESCYGWCMNWKVRPQDVTKDHKKGYFMSDDVQQYKSCVYFGRTGDVNAPLDSIGRFFCLHELALHMYV
jgi:hypothetical protein